MNLMRNVKEALLNFSAAKLRSALALLGILVGTASVVAMVSGGQLATNEALKQFKTLGTDLLSVSISEMPSEERVKKSEANLELSQVENLGALDPTIADIAPYTQLFNSVQYEGKPLNGMVLGVNSGFQRILHIKMQAGRFISSLDNYALFCVIGHDTYEQMKKLSYKNPIGSQIQIGSSYFTVIGVADTAEANSFVWANVNTTVLIPLLSSTSLSKYAAINNIIIRLTPGANIENVNEKLNAYFNKILPSKKLYVRDAKQLIASMSKQSQILTIFLGLIGGISLLVGGIGVMNIMLVSVVERKKEIGIRLAVGARRKDIRSLFLIEAIMLSLVGGGAGVLIGVMIEFLIAQFWHWEFIWFFWPPMIGFSVSVAIGIFFGFYPAYKASQLNPIDALRSD